MKAKIVLVSPTPNTTNLVVFEIFTRTKAGQAPKNHPCIALKRWPSLAMDHLPEGISSDRRSSAMLAPKK